MTIQEEKALVAEILTDSFDTNKSVNYVTKQDSKQNIRRKVLMEYSYSICKEFGEVIINDDHTGCALVALPHQKKDNLFSIRQDIRLVRKCIGVDRIFKVLKRESMIKKSYPEKPFCYLWFIGVPSDKQKRGIGTKLLQEIIDKYEKLGMDIYLETSTLSNIPWYKSQGFKIYREIDEFGFTLFCMKRLANSISNN